MAVILLPNLSIAEVISVNFHSDDLDAEAEHQISEGEVAGLIPKDGVTWNNLSVGSPGAHADTETLIAATQLIDDSGNANAATIETSVESSWFVGYAASTATRADELSLDLINDDDLFNSYLGLNGPNGDGTPLDAAVINITNLSSEFTSQGYSLIIYSDSDRGAANAATRTSVFTVTPEGGSAVSRLVEDDGSLGAEDGTFSGAYVLSDELDSDDAYSNYTVIDGLTAENFTIEVSSPDGGRGAISGFQLVSNQRSDIEITSIDFDDSGAAPAVTLTFTSVPETTYVIEYSTDLITWQELTDNAEATGTSTSYVDSVEVLKNPERLYYRVQY